LGVRRCVFSKGRRGESGDTDQQGGRKQSLTEFELHKNFPFVNQFLKSDVSAASLSCCRYGCAFPPELQSVRGAPIKRFGRLAQGCASANCISYRGVTFMPLKQSSAENALNEGLATR
jgi:hypothetical protein